ncbi:MAG TPA: hypothetical protein VGV90_01340 [Solirubrobacteraceae bacterium]|nr:hypothetical protein [Solirubrobacteraceae bacterium]
MAEPAIGDATATYLVELYRPGLRVDALTLLAANVRHTISVMQLEGEHVAIVSSTIVPGDEYVLCVVQATSERLVRDAFARAGIALQRISAAISTHEAPADGHHLRSDDQCSIAELLRSRCSAPATLNTQETP